MKIFVNGSSGKMGTEVSKLILNSKEMELLYELELSDVVIDFSAPESTLAILPYCISHHIPIVIATTGFTENQQHEIENASTQIPIFQSSNMSYGINLMIKIISELSCKLPDADIEIVETHHNQKKDSPSGTALLLADSINFTNSYVYDFNRMQKSQKRNPKEIGFSSIRGGNIVGEHSVFFFSNNETLEIKHTAHSRVVFAEGALKAAKFLLNQKIGLYSINDLV